MEILIPQTGPETILSIATTRELENYEFSFAGIQIIEAILEDAELEKSKLLRWERNDHEQWEVNEFVRP